MASCQFVLIVMASILGPVTLVFMAVSFGTDHWLRYEVDRDMLSPTDKVSEHDRYSHTRHRGLFRECYPGNDTKFLDNNPDVVDDYCFIVSYDMPDKTSDKSKHYLTRIHLSRLFLAFFIIALIFFVVAFIFGLILCCNAISRWAYLAGLLAYVSAFSLAAAIAFFHGMEYMERNDIRYKGFYLNWPQGIQHATTRSYEWSYVLAWVGMVLATITATFYAVAGCCIAADRYEDRERLDKDYLHRRGLDHPMYAVDDPYLGKPHPMYALDYPQPYSSGGPFVVAAPEPPRVVMATPEPQRYVVAAPETARYVMAEPAHRETWNIRDVEN